MKKFIIKLITLIIAFVLGILCTSYFYNKGNLDMTAHMAEATLPILYFERDGEYLNQIYGYTSEIDASCLRDSIMPLDGDRTLQIALEKYNAKIQSVSFEVRSIDMERLIQNGEVENLEETGQYLKGSVKIKDLLEDSEEYLLIFHVALENYEDVQYFSRISNSSYELVDTCTQFALEFHNATLDPANVYPLTQYLEQDTSRKNTTLARVDIHSRYKTVIWDGMSVKELQGPEITYLELEDDVVSLNLDYQVGYENENGETEKYQVKDYFRIRHTNTRMYLLDYERTTERIFSIDNEVFGEKSLNLGVQWEEVAHMSNEEGNVVNFVVSDELWSYDLAQNKLSKVFSFKNGNDRRGLHDEFEIQLINMEDSGSMDFVVTGYMNRGSHEGQTGVAVMRYNSLTNTTEELLFIEGKECFGMLSKTVGELLYISFDEKMYLSYGGDIYAIDLNMKTVETLTENLTSDNYLISRGGDMIAWQHGNDKYVSTKITTMDMKNGMKKTYSAAAGEYIRPLGFSGSDFIYGVCKESDMVEDFAGNTMFPMYCVKIVNNKGESIRDFDYLSKNKYALSATMESNRIDLQCVSKNADGSYSETLSETITSTEEVAVTSIVLNEQKDSVKKLEQVFTFDVKVEGKRKDVVPKQILFEENRTMAFVNEDAAEKFHSYGKGKVTGVYAELRKAVLRAYDDMGVVCDQNGQIIWERGGRKTRSVLELSNGHEPVEASNSLEAAIKLLLEQEGIYTDVQSAMSEGLSAYQVLKQNSKKHPEDFTGCNLSSMLYYISEGNYVLAMTSAHNGELIVGYDAQNIYVLDAMSGKVTKVGQKDATARYEAVGNVFFSFLK